MNSTSVTRFFKTIVSLGGSNNSRQFRWGLLLSKMHKRNFIHLVRKCAQEELVLRNILRTYYMDDP